MGSLVSVMAKELSAWPDEEDYFTCDPGGEIRASIDTKHDFRPKEAVDESDWTKDHAGLSDDLPRVTRDQWQAERDRQKGGEWKRHRGGKQPVFEGKVEVKFRDGDIEEWFSHSLDWSHNGKGRDIMQYRIISQPQAEEVEVRKFTQDLNMHTPQGEFIRGPISLNDEVIYPAEAQWQQSTGPLAWRDTIIHCQAIIEDCEREIAKNENLLALEGFSLIPAMTPVAGVADVDMSDWRNWKAGDIVECVTSEYEGTYDNGKQYVVEWVNDEMFSVYDNYGGASSCDWFDHDAEGLKFIRRP